MEVKTLVSMIKLASLIVKILEDWLPSNNKLGLVYEREVGTSAEVKLLILVMHYAGLVLTFLISAMISFGSLEDVVFMLQVNLKERGLISPLSFTALLKPNKLTF